MSVRSERGSVMVLAAAAIFPLMMLLAFTIDTSHWFDYSRNLQNRADAAALAGAAAFGNICLEGGTPGNVTTGAQAAIGQWAQLYSGAGTSEPAGQLPYTNAQVATGTGWDVTNNGYINNTNAASPVPSPLTLKLGSLNNYWVVLNGNNYAENGGTSFSMTSTGSGATFCNSDPKFDVTDPNRASAGAAGPMVDVKVSQRSLPLFFPLISGRPTIHAHARVQLEGESSTVSEPIAVGDNGFTPCVTAYFYSTADNSLLGTAVLTKEAQPTQTSPIIWDNSTQQIDSGGNPIPNTGPLSFTMPTTGNVYVVPYLNNCNGSGDFYDGGTNTDPNGTAGTGVLMINRAPATAPTVNLNDPPKMMPNGVKLFEGTCQPDAYFAVATGDCLTEVDAYVKFESSIDKSNQTAVFAVDHQWDPTLNNGAGAWTTAAPVALNQQNSGPVKDLTHWSGNIPVGDTSGIHQIEITWKQTAGNVGATACGNGNGGNPPPCTGTFGIQQQAFGACNGCDTPNDSGPIIRAQLSTAGVGGWGANSYPSGGPVNNLVITLELSGLSSAPANAGPADDTVLRYSAASNHQTGLIDCGQGSGANADAEVVYSGCGPGNKFFSPPLNPLFVWSRTDGSGCSPQDGTNSTGWPSGNHQDCVETTPGQRRVAIVCNLVLRMTGEPFNTSCNNNNNPPACTGSNAPCCPPNNWSTGSIPGNDPRAVTMIITSTVDLAAGIGSPQFWVPIRRFATFYVTGWDSNINPQCTSGTLKNDPFPTKGKKSSQNGAIWGHWMNYSDSAGIGNNQACPINSVQPTNCVPVLTR